MLLVSNKPILSANPTGWINCGDPIPTPDEGYVFVPYPANSDTVLSVQANGSFQTVPLSQAGPAQYMQLKGNALECEVNGALVFLCIQDLK